eukprot:325242_1
MSDTDETECVNPYTSLQNEYQTLCKNFNELPNKRILSCMENSSTQLNLSSASFSDTDKIQNNEIIPLFEAIKSSNSQHLFTKIDLSWNRITDSGAKSIASFLLNNKHIIDVNLKGNDITSIGGTEIMKSLITTYSTVNNNEIALNSLNLNGNKLGDDTMILLSELFTNTKIKQLCSLDIGNCDFGHMGWTYIMNRLIENKFIQELNIQNCRVTTLSHEMCSVLSKVLYHNRTIKTLNISFQGDGIGDDGMRWISNSLKGNHILESLDLSCNRIGCDGIRFLSDILSKCKTSQPEEACSLKYLSLRGNRLTNIGARYICKFIEFNKTLEYLDLRSTGLKDEGLYLIAETINTMKNRNNDIILKTILLDDNYFDSKSAAMWRTVVEDRDSKILQFDFWPLIVE